MMNYLFAALLGIAIGSIGFYLDEKKLIVQPQFWVMYGYFFGIIATYCQEWFYRKSE